MRFLCGFIPFKLIYAICTIIFFIPISEVQTREFLNRNKIWEDKKNAEESEDFMNIINQFLKEKNVDVNEIVV